MFAWLPVTIFGIAFLPFTLAVSAFIAWWIFLTYEPAYVRSYDDTWEYVEYKGSFWWGAIGTALLVWLFYTLVGEISWAKFLEVYPVILVTCFKWACFGAPWALVRWIVEAYRGCKRWDRNAKSIANDKYDGDVSKLTDEQKYELSKTLPKAKEYRWRFFRWGILWPMSLLDTFFRDLVKLIWEWIYNLVSNSLDKIARAIYGHRYVAYKPENKKR